MELFAQQPPNGRDPVPKTFTPEFKLLFENYCVPLRYNYRCEDDAKTFFFLKQRCCHLIGGHC